MTTVNISIDPNRIAPAVGDKATDFTARTIDGQTVSLGSLQGQPVWLVFGATWCTNCRDEAPDIQSLVDENAGQLTVVSIYVGETTKDVQGYATKLKLTNPQIADTTSELGSTYAVMGLPTHVFIDAEGTIREIHLGALGKDAAAKILEGLI